MEQDRTRPPQEGPGPRGLGAADPARYPRGMATENAGAREPDFSPAQLATTTEVVYLPSGRLGPDLKGQSVDRTEVPCPLCAEAGNKTAGGDTPTLRAIEGRTFCVGSHGWVEASPTTDTADRLPTT
jgi:hypothetical protein